MHAKLYIMMMTLLIVGGLISGCVVEPGGRGYGHQGPYYEHDRGHDHERDHERDHDHR